MRADEKLVGEGTLGWVDAVGGPRVVLPFVAGSAAIVALAVWGGYGWPAVGAGALVPAWFAWRVGLFRNLSMLVRNGAPRYRVELDDVGARTIRPDGKTFDVEWFTLERFHLADHGVVLVLRVAKEGANAVFVPRAFFGPSEWDAVLALVREKLPGSARAHDAAQSATQAHRARMRRQLPWRLALAGAMLAGLYALLRVLE